MSDNTIEIYDPVVDTLNPSPIKMLCFRCYHKSITYKDRLYVFGGKDLLRFETLNSVEMYSPDTKKFVMMSPMKYARHSFGCCRMNNLVFVVGGEFLREKVVSTEIYDLDTDTWSDGADFPGSMHVVSACSVKKEIKINNKTQVEVVEAPKENKPFSLFNFF